MLFDRAGQVFRIGGAFRLASIVELRFAGDASDHQGLHEQEAGPSTSDDVDQMPKIWTDASQNILIEDEKRLDSSNFPLSVLQHKIQIFEFGMDRVVDQIVIAVIFVL
jgi:hypothetical protein